jgi:hypothetical protein
LTVAWAAAYVPAFHYWPQEPCADQYGTLLVILEVGSFDNAVVLFLEPLERLQGSREGRVPFWLVACQRHRFTLRSNLILLFYRQEIHFDIDLKSAVPSSV